MGDEGVKCVDMGCTVTAHMLHYFGMRTFD